MKEDWPVRYSQASLPLAHGLFEMVVYRDQQGRESVAVYQGAIAEQEDPVFTRIHSECLTGEVFYSRRCDCRQQLDLALDSISRRQVGLVIYLRQEGRGIGLGEKIKAYHLQNKGLDTVEANEALGHPYDCRSFEPAAVILQDLGVGQIALNTNNPDKIRQLRSYGVQIAQVIPSITPVQAHNARYLETKYRVLGHTLKGAFSESAPSFTDKSLNENPTKNPNTQYLNTEYPIPNKSTDKNA